MNLYIQLYLGLIILLCGTVMGTGLLVFFYFKLLKRHAKLEEEELLKAESIGKETLELLNKAQEDYKKRIQEAEEKAKKIVNEAKNERKETEETLNDTFKELNKEEIRLIKETSRNLLKKYGLQLKLEKMKDLNLQNNISEDIEDYQKNVLEEAKQSQKLLEESIDKSHDSIEKELEAYKKTRIEELDKNILEIIKRTTAITVGKGIDVQGQEKLVIEALEEAKREGKIK